MTAVSQKMSEKSKTKSSGLKAHQNINEKQLQQHLVTPVPEPTDLKAIPFPEWSNDDMNSTTFSVMTISGKVKDKTEKSDKTEKEKPDKHDDLKIFEDPQVSFLPFYLHEAECEWKRARDIFSEYELVIFTKTSDYPQLLTDSSHLVHSPFMRSFISSVTILEYLANKTNFQTEATTGKFTFNADGPWKPWHHIYSTGKAGASSGHNPQVNNLGRYFVRLFWLGTWRRVTVDDYLPVDKTGHVLLPSLPIPPPIRPMTAHTESTVASSGKKKRKRDKSKGRKAKTEKREKSSQLAKVELWPFLLSKAILKLANMTMNKDKDLEDFNVIHCLTGWVMQHVELEHENVSADEMWEICVRYTKLYSWFSPEELKVPPKVEKRSKKKKAKKKKKRLKILNPGNSEAKNPHSFVVLCRDMRSLKSAGVQDISPCWGHEIVIDECRDIPLEQPPPDPEYPLWKKFRWLEWAKSKGLIEEPFELDRTRYVKCVAPFKQFSMQKVHTDINAKESDKKPEFPFRKSINLLAKKFLNVVPQETASESERSHHEEMKTPRSEAGEKTKGKKEPEVTTLHDPSFWVKFDDLFNYLLAFDVFFKPSQFVHKARISDLELNEIVKPGPRGSKGKTTSRKEEDTWQNIKWFNGVRNRGNMPLYFFIDSLDTKVILINMYQAGDVERLVPMEDELSEHNFFVEYDRLFGEKTKSASDKTVTPRKLKLNRPKIHMNLKSANLLFEEVGWDKAEGGKIVSFLSTYANSSTMLELEASRFIFRVWIKSEFPFCVTVLSDTGFTIGTFEQIVENMTVEPMMITQFSLNITKAYAELVNSFGTNSYPKCLQSYYQSYLPKDANTILTKQQKSSIHDAFLRSFLQYLQNTQIAPNIQRIIDALRTLFLNVEICVRQEMPMQRAFSLPMIHSLQEKIICERASTRLSAFFKYVQVKMLKRRHKINHDRFHGIFETLKLVYADVFSRDKREECLGTVIRNFFDDQTIEEFLPFYNYSNAFAWDVHVQTFTGNAEFVKDFAILCRYLLQFTKSTLLNIKLFSSIPHYSLSVIDNDTNAEIYRFSNEIFPHTFAPNSYGYTVIGFAWSKDIELINWKLVIISNRKTKTDFSVEEIKTSMNVLFDHYVPICQNLIGKHIITLTENVVFTLRFSCSYKNLKFNIKLFDADDNLLVDIFGTEKIVLPSVLLKNTCRSNSLISSRSRSNRSLLAKGRMIRSTNSDLMKPNKKDQAALRKIREIVSESSTLSETYYVTTYRLEIYVVDDSWPLTLSEWDTVKKLRESTYFINRSKHEFPEVMVVPSRSSTKSLKDIRKSLLRRNESIEKPWYLLQYAFKLNAQARLDKDKTEEEQTYNLKKSWYVSDPERYQRSMDMRQRYVAQHGCLCPEEYNVSINSKESIASTVGALAAQGSRTSREHVDDENAYRTTKCPRCIEIGIPPFDLSPYYRPKETTDVQQKYVKTDEDHVADRRERERIWEEYNESMIRTKTNMEMWINESKEKTTLVSLWYEDCRKASEEVMNDYYAMRQNYLEKCRIESIPPKKVKKKKTKKMKRK